MEGNAHGDRPVKVLALLARTIASTGSGTPLPLRMSEACVSILGVDGGSLTVAYAESERVTLCSTDRWAAELDDIHDVVGDGPSFAAYNERSVMRLVVDGPPDERWPLFSNSVKDRLGECVIHAVPMMPGPQTMGVATFYQVRPTPLLIDEETSQMLINAVGVALIRDPDVLDDERFSQANSWSNRAKISQATGMVMAQLRLPADDALAILRAHAYAQGWSLSGVSDLVVSRRLDFRSTDLDVDGEL
jgi:hypothetical protein